MHHLRWLPLSILLALALVACNGSSNGSNPSAPGSLQGATTVLGSIPHVDSPWTEGLQLIDGQLWESDGLNGKSQVRAADPATGNLLWSVPNPSNDFNEGLVQAFGRTYVLTWKEGKVYDFNRDRNPIYRQFATYTGEGWGLTSDGKQLIMSNGSANLYYRDPTSFEITREVPIRYQNQPVERLNELDFDGTWIWANQWQTRYIYAIRASDPTIVVRFELPAGLCASPNGIAWSPNERLFYITGQACDKIWKVRLE